MVDAIAAITATTAADMADMVAVLGTLSFHGDVSPPRVYRSVSGGETLMNKGLFVQNHGLHKKGIEFTGFLCKAH
jgi:hypothetical protein